VNFDINQKIIIHSIIVEMLAKLMTNSDMMCDAQKSIKFTDLKHLYKEGYLILACDVSVRLADKEKTCRRLKELIFDDRYIAIDIWNIVFEYYFSDPIITITDRAYDSRILKCADNYAQYEPYESFFSFANMNVYTDMPINAEFIITFTPLRFRNGNSVIVDNNGRVKFSEHNSERVISIEMYMKNNRKKLIRERLCYMPELFGNLIPHNRLSMHPIGVIKHPQID
jgi:hypothetical protein